jgi:hypothetical protein
VAGGHPGGVGVDDGGEIGRQTAAHPVGQVVEQSLRRHLDEQLGGDVEQFGVPVG